MNTRIKDSDKNLDQIRLDNFAMRRDLATFEAELDEKHTVSGNCDQMLGRICGQIDSL